MPNPERGYRWGKFQAWLSLAIGLALFVAGFAPWIPAFAVRLMLYFCGALFFFLGAGLLHKRRYGFVLLYVIAVLTLLGVLQSPAGTERHVTIITGIGLWVIPAVLYYPKRYREFGFGRKGEAAQPEEFTTRQRAARIATGLGTGCYVVSGIVGFIVSMSIVSKVTGFWGFAIAFALFPITFVAAPWYALFHWGTWIPVAINYGGMISAWVLGWIGETLDPSA
jgi:hypothetical protein